MNLSLAQLRQIATAIIAFTAIVAALGLGKLQLNSHYSAYFNDSDPLLRAHEAISEIYARDDGLFVVLQSTSSFLSAENYQLLERLTAELQAQPYSTRVVSITELGIIGDSPLADDTKIPSILQLQDDGRALGLLLSDNLVVAGIWVQFQLPDKQSLTILETVDAVRLLVDSALGTTPITAHYTGTLALNEAYISSVRHDLKLILPLLLLVVTLLLSRLMRSKWAVLAMLPVGVFSVMAAFGIAGLFRAELAAISTFTPVIIFSISVAGCVHMVHSYVHYRDLDYAPGAAALAAANRNRIPMSLANGTTAIGFLGLALSPSPPIRVVGYLVATGIVVSFLLCMTLLPTLLARFDPWKPPSSVPSMGMNKLAKFVTRRRGTLIVVFLSLSLPAAWLASRNVISDNVFEYFSSSHVFHRDTQLVDRHLSGVNEVLYSVDFGKDLKFFESETIDELSRFTSWLSEQAQVRRVVSIVDSQVVKAARAEGQLQQRLDVYRNRLDTGGGNALRQFALGGNYSSALVTTYLGPLDSAELSRFDRKVHAWAGKNLQNLTLRSGGPTLMFASLGEQNIRSMLTALTAALFMAAIVLGIVFRSVRIAWVGMICNFLPILFVYSVWALVSGQISIGAAVVMGMVLGIVLDDTVYFISSYHHGVRSKNKDPVCYALNRIGPALIVTSTALVAGLSMGLLSDFGPIWSMSALSVSIITVALVVDLLLLPALVSPVRAQGART